ncbi:MAG: hypothetical protein HY908_04640 [Myxococcales bacterium]|nr:hypothetical protein [Myxococcales bacterium]MCC6526083.1 hypothetical protein [Polyangiaceae bacterium]
MRLSGDPEGIAQLKALHGEDREYLKFLVGEAKSNTDLTAPFVGKNGARYLLKVDPRSGDLVVEPRASTP